MLKVMDNFQLVKKISLSELSVLEAPAEKNVKINKYTLKHSSIRFSDLFTDIKYLL